MIDVKIKTITSDYGAEEDVEIYSLVDDILECPESCEIKEKFINTSYEKFFSVPKANLERDTFITPIYIYDFDKLSQIIKEFNLKGFKCGQVYNKQFKIGRLWCQFENRTVEVQTDNTEQAIRFLEYHFEMYQLWQ